MAYLLGMDSNGLSPDQSNSLDEMAAAMIDKNAEYAEDLIDHHSDELPTFHVVHEENDLDPSPSRNNLKPYRNAEKPMTLQQNDLSSISSTSTESEITETSQATSSSSSSDTSASDVENAITRMPYKPKADWTIDGEGDTSSEDTSSMEEEEVNYTIPRMEDEILNKKPKQPKKPKRQEKRKIEPRQMEYPETTFADDTVTTGLPGMARPRDETIKPAKRHTQYPRLVPDEETVAREIEQLRAMVDDRYDDYKEDFERAIGLDPANVDTVADDFPVDEPA